jgi:hypothetical protein
MEAASSSSETLEIGTDANMHPKGVGVSASCELKVGGQQGERNGNSKSYHGCKNGTSGYLSSMQ